MDSPERKKLKARMPNEDPSDYSIKDFLGETKYDAENAAATRFESVSESVPQPTELFYVTCFANSKHPTVTTSPQKAKLQRGPVQVASQLKEYIEQTREQVKAIAKSPKKTVKDSGEGKCSDGDGECSLKKMNDERLEQAKEVEGKENVDVNVVPELSGAKSPERRERVMDETVEEIAESKVQASSNTEGFCALLEDMLVDCGFKRKANASGRFNVILGADNAVGIPFARISQLFRYDYGIKPHCNYLKNYECLLEDALLYKSVQKELCGSTIAPNMGILESFVFVPNEIEVNDETLMELKSVLKHLARDCEESKVSDIKATKSCWIIEEVSPHQKQLNATLVNLDKGETEEKLWQRVNDGVLSLKTMKVKRFLSNPLLISGKRFSVNFLALVNHKYDVFVCSKSYMAIEMREFDISNFKDGERIQYKMKNVEVFNSEFLKRELCGALGVSSESINDSLLENAKLLIGTVFRLNKAKLFDELNDDYTSFHLMSFEMVFDDLKRTYLAGIHPSPKLPIEMQLPVAKEVFELAIKPVYSDVIEFKNLKDESNFDGKNGLFMKI